MIKFNRSHACIKVNMLLNEILQEYKNGFSEIKNVDVLIKNINLIKSSVELFDKFVDMILVDDIITIIREYINGEKGKIIIPNYDSLLSSFDSSGIQVSGKEGLILNGHVKAFSNYELLRKYLYDVIGFEYQSSVNNFDDNSVVDPLCNADFDLLIPMFAKKEDYCNFLVNSDCVNYISNFNAPKHEVEKQPNRKYA